MKTTSTRLRIGSLLSILTAATTAMAQPGSGILLSDFMVLKPSATFTVNHTDNANLTARSMGVEETLPGTLNNAEKDTFFTQGVALDLSNRAGAVPVNGRAWWTNQSYDKYNQLDNQAYGVGVNTQLGGQKTSLSLAADYQHAVESSEVFEGVNDSLISEVQVLSQRLERDEYTARTSLSHDLTDKTQLSLGYSYKQTDFEDATFRDISEQTVSGRASRAVNAFIDVYIEVGSQHIDQEKSATEDLEYFNGWEDPFVYMGIDADRPLKITDKLSFTIGAGWVTRSRVAQDGTRKTEEEAMLALNGNLVYAVSPKTTFTLAARNGYENDSTPGSSLRDSTSVNAKLSNQLTDRISHHATAGWRKDNYLDLLPTSSGLIDEKKETMVYTYSITYTTLRPWLSVFGNIHYEDGSSNIPDEPYTETRLSAGVQLSY